MKNKVQLLAIDCQRDFCQAPNPELAKLMTEANGGNTNSDIEFIKTGGSLYVAGANEDMGRLSQFISKFENKLDNIHVTLDTHKTVQVFHPIFWINSKLEHPSPFTIISIDDVRNGVWKTTNPSWITRGIEYVETLTEKGKYPLCIWAYHCIEGSIGHALIRCVSDSIVKWEKNNLAMVNYCPKGDYYFSESYGALEAEVPVLGEPTTMLNTKLVSMLQEADELLIAGEALSHCVKSTVEQVAKAFGADNIKKLVLLKDCCSNVPTFEKLGEDFIREMTGRGMRVTTTEEYSI